MKIFMFFMFLINITFMNFNNPLILGLLTIIQTINVMMMMGKIYYTFWFSYIMFLVFIGGLFILFFYMISLIFNNKFFYYINKSTMMLMLIIMFMNYKLNYFNNMESNLSMNYLNENINLMKLYNFPNNFINLFLIFFLLLMMIIVVKITNFSLGPMRTN